MQSNTAVQISTIAAKPILKWAGGKTQMLGELLPKVPSSYGRYIEPFFGGGALFFALQPENAVIADSNPELINMYRQVADHVDNVISYLEKYQNTSEMFYSVRSLDWETLPKAEAAAAEEKPVKKTARKAKTEPEAAAEAPQKRGRKPKAEAEPAAEKAPAKRTRKPKEPKE